MVGGTPQDLARPSMESPPPARAHNVDLFHRIAIEETARNDERCSRSPRALVVYADRTSMEFILYILHGLPLP